MQTRVIMGQEARDLILEGINEVANPVKATLGPKGGLSSLPIYMGGGVSKVTKDGVSVARSIHLKNPATEKGASFARAVASKTVDMAGDGTTTATILLQSIANESNKYIVTGIRPANIKKGIDLAVNTVLAEISKISRPVKSSSEIAQVGTISANGDKEIGAKIAEAMEKVGKEGVITVEESPAADLELDIVQGMRFDKGYINPYFCTDPHKKIAELEDPYILLLKTKIINPETIEPILTQLLQKGKPILIVAEDYEPPVLNVLVSNKMRGLPIFAVKAPMTPDVLEDIAIMTGANVFVPEHGKELQHTTVDITGRARRVIITADHTTIVNGIGDAKDVEARCNALRDEIEEKKKTHKVTGLQERLARLTGGIAVLKVGGDTEVEMKERKDRVDDAVCATKAAVEEGIVAGGGVTLYYATRALNDLIKSSDLDAEVIAGINIVKKALEAPCRQIAENADKNGDVVIAELEKSLDTDFGFDAGAMEYTNLFERGIIDPTKVLTSALKTAASVAVNVIDLTSNIFEDKEEIKK